MRRTVWRDADTENLEYVPRCSFCGKYKSHLKRHWFFTGLYCLGCVQEVLYNDVRNIAEVSK